MAMRKRDDEGRFGLAGAFGVSIAIHVLLALLTLVVPIVTETAALEELEPESEITFSFVDRPDLEDDVNAQDTPPDGNEPLPDPVPPEPPPVEEAPPEETLAEDEPLEFPEEVAPEEPMEAPIEEPIEQPDTDPQPLEESGQPSDPSAARTQPNIDVNQALRDYGRRLSQRPPSPTPSNSDSPRNVIVPDFSQIPSTGFGMGNLTFESADYDWTDYGRQIYMAIWRAWHNRLWMSTDAFEKWSYESGESYLNNQTQVGFVIERNGQVTGIVQEGASGCLPLDESALDALAEVILPPLPVDFPRDREVVHARFIAIGEVRAMRQSLSRLKRAGMF